MQNRWNPAAAAACPGELALRAYSSRLIGAEPALVLYGGGNASLKTGTGEAAVLHVKGSGADLGGVAEADFTPLSLAPLRALLADGVLGAPGLGAALTPWMLRAGAPRPSIETFMHAALPWKFVEHTHAAAVLAICNTRDGDAHVLAAFGGQVVVVPYHHSGFDLARACAGAYADQFLPGMRGMVLMHHGACAWGDTARESYDAMIALATRAEDYLRAHGAWELESQPAPPLGFDTALAIAGLRREASRAAGRPLVATLRDDPFIFDFARRADIGHISVHGPATPGHAVFTKRTPQLGGDVAAFAAAYGASLQGTPGLDAAPRVILDPRFGLLGLGVNKFYADAAADVFRSDAAVMARAEKLGGYATIGNELMRRAEIEYAGFEAKVAKREPNAGRVAVIADALSQRAQIGRLLDGGCAVAALDHNPEIAALDARPNYLGIQIRPASQAEEARVVKCVVRAFGGVDEVVGTPDWARVFAPLVELAV